MSQDDFFDFVSLLKKYTLVVRKTNTDGEHFKWHDVQWLKYSKEEGQILYRNSLIVGPFKQVSFLRRGLRSTHLLKRYTCSVPISVGKKQDLIDLLQLVPPVFHNFYLNLSTTADAQSIDPDLLEVDPDE